MNTFIRFIAAQSAPGQEAIAALEAAIGYKAFKKGAQILQMQHRCSHLYFLQSGLVKGYFLNDKGEENIFRFFSENGLFTSLDSFLNQTPSAHIIQALEPTEVYFITKADLDRLSGKYESVQHFYNWVFKTATANMLSRFTEMTTQDAATRYHNFVAQNGALLQRISLGDLAAYLGITQSTLSRIRALK